MTAAFETNHGHPCFKPHLLRQDAFPKQKKTFYHQTVRIRDTLIERNLDYQHALP